MCLSKHTDDSEDGVDNAIISIALTADKDLKNQKDLFFDFRPGSKYIANAKIQMKLSKRLRWKIYADSDRTEQNEGNRDWQYR